MEKRQRQAKLWFQHQSPGTLWPTDFVAREMMVDDRQPEIRMPAVKMTGWRANKDSSSVFSQSKFEIEFG
jgi:hypothetical protein